MQKSNQIKTVAIIVAGGKGKRMGQPKQFLKIAGKPMLEWTIAAFEKAAIIDGIILVVAKENLPMACRLKSSKLLKVVAGGTERQDSVKNGLRQLPDKTEIVVIHDGARPAVSEEIINRSVQAARRYGAALAAVPVKDTIKKIKNQKSCLPAGTAKIKKIIKVEKTLERDELWAAQTPQTFKANIIREAYAKSKGSFTDDAALVERLNKPVSIIFGSYANIKVTTPEDLAVMKNVLTGR